MAWLLDNWLIVLLLLLILVLLSWIVRLQGGIRRAGRAIVAAIPFRRSFGRAYLDTLRQTQGETPALLVRGDLATLDLIRAFAKLRVEIEQLPSSTLDNDPNQQRSSDPFDLFHPQPVFEKPSASDKLLLGWWRRRSECNQPANTPGGAIWRYQWLVIRGKPGSGKTTLLKHITVTCARDLRGKASKQQENGTREIYGWPRPLFPIYIPLRSLARACPDWESCALLDAYEQALGTIFGPSLRAPHAGWFQRRLRQGGCVLLIDGFDELRDEVQRDKMSQLIRELERVELRRSNAIVVTTRPVGYEGQLDSSFELREIAPLNQSEVAALVEARYTAIHERESRDRRPDWQPTEKAERLTTRLDQSESLRRLSSNPLMLSLIVGIHHRQEDGELPQERYKVYELAVDYLTERWEIQRGRVAGERVSRGSLNLDEKRKLAASLAWAMFNQVTDPMLQRTAAREQLESYLLISRRAAVDILASSLEPILSGRIAERGPALAQACRDQALIWLTDLGTRGGLLQGEGNDDSLDAPIQFAHKSIQEYLAAQAIDTEPKQQILLNHWDDDDWREVLLLYAASQQADPVIRHLLRQNTPKSQLLAGWCLYERPRNPPGIALQDEAGTALRGLLLNQDISPDENIAAMTILEGIGGTVLERSLLEQTASQAISPIVRARAVEMLVPYLEDEPTLCHVLANIASNDSDYRPRIVAGFALSRGDPRYESDGWIPELVEVPGGPFLMGSSDVDELAAIDEWPQHQLELPTFWIGKTPVTNAQWRRFVETDGYTIRDYWTETGWRWVTKHQVTQPHYWDDEYRNGDNQPVVGVSWYEAVAYCRWLSAVTGQEFYLPSEAEWEKAARGSHGQRYPWSNEWRSGCCNSAEAGFRRLTPVGSFPAGASPYGALDLAGNVYEWCATKDAKPYPYDLTEDEWATAYLEGSTDRRARGASYWDVLQAMHSASRLVSLDPSHHFSYVGFRVASRAARPTAES